MSQDLSADKAYAFLLTILGSRAIGVDANGIEATVPNAPETLAHLRAVFGFGGLLSLDEAFGLLLRPEKHHATAEACKSAHDLATYLEGVANALRRAIADKRA